LSPPGAGYVGSHTVLALGEAGETVVVIDNLSTGVSADLPEGVTLFIGDAADKNDVESVIAVHAVESIMHFAGSVVVPDSMRDQFAYYRNNTMTTRSLLNAAVKCVVSFFIFSSAAAVLAIRISCRFPNMRRRRRFRLTAHPKSCCMTQPRRTA
jgi:UDP-glucose 4-epimerase